MPTCVAQSALELAARLVIPLAPVPGPLDVDLHAVLVGLLVVGLPGSPVRGLLRQRLPSAYPDPLSFDLADPNPVVSGRVAEYGVQVLNLLLVLNCHQVGIPLLAVGAGLVKVHVLRGGVVGPGSALSDQEER